MRKLQTESEREAREIASLVEVSYKNKQQVLTNIRDAISNKSFYPLHLKDIVKGDVDTALENSQYTVGNIIVYLFIFFITKSFKFYYNFKNAFKISSIWLYFDTNVKIFLLCLLEQTYF